MAQTVRRVCSVHPGRHSWADIVAGLLMTLRGVIGTMRPSMIRRTRTQSSRLDKKNQSRLVIPSAREHRSVSELQPSITTVLDQSTLGRMLTAGEEHCEMSYPVYCSSCDGAWESGDEGRLGNIESEVSVTLCELGPS
jgi:hypothetical protein